MSFRKLTKNEFWRESIISVNLYFIQQKKIINNKSLSFAKLRLDNYIILDHHIPSASMVEKCNLIS